MAGSQPPTLFGRQGGHVRGELSGDTDSHDPLTNLDAFAAIVQ
jgi:hypothetical protein